MLDELKARSGRIKRYTIVACAVGIIILPGFLIDMMASLLIIVLALIGGQPDSE